MKNILSDNFTKIVLGLFVAASGVLGGDVLGYYDLSQKRDSKREEITYRDNIDCVTNYEKQIRQMSNVVSDLKNRMMLLELTKLPIPFWEKDRQSNVIYINDVGQKLFLDPIDISANQLIGSNGLNLFEQDTIQKFMRNDRKVIRENKMIVFLEYSTNGRMGWSFKAPIKTNHGGVIGTMGFWIDDYYVREIEKIKAAL